MLIEDIVEDEGAFWTDGTFSWLFINKSYYLENRVQAVDGTVSPYADVSLEAAF